MTLLDHIQQTRPDVVWVTGPDGNGNYSWDPLLPNQSEIEALVAGFDFAQSELDKIVFGVIEGRRIWAQGMMERLKKANYDANLNLSQSLWVHSRLRALDVTIVQAHLDAFPNLAAQLAPIKDIPLKIDLLNLVISGDLETAFVVLMATAPDPMTEAYHSFDQNMINWIMNEIALYLGWA